MTPVYGKLHFMMLLKEVLVCGGAPYPHERREY
jgi:hypothetical protein